MAVNVRVYSRLLLVSCCIWRPRSKSSKFLLGFLKNSKKTSKLSFFLFLFFSFSFLFFSRCFEKNSPRCKNMPQKNWFQIVYGKSLIHSRRWVQWWEIKWPSTKHSLISHHNSNKAIKLHALQIWKCIHGFGWFWHAPSFGPTQNNYLHSSKCKTSIVD